MSEFSDRVKDQVEQFNSSVDQIVNAYRGLYTKIKEESNKQFEELVKTGEQQLSAEESFLAQLKKDITTPFDDVKGSLDQIKNAYVGLVVKARNSGEQYFDELVELGSSKLTELKSEIKDEIEEVKKPKASKKLEAEEAE
ncbi:hypothetical protein FT643_12475 [Ketobacter sp. MCCC 1A13808]|uniref:hypothetical protein n=1 Tax=Ketobacter sp. MCCC 1A13808 TaxID=2602738 RepID=UPI000F1C52E4|nr:hypothetical protein [Ketobacter sp. MCCC 1A13808]MVF12955.1 hypothetical protein [Ketobacter sp. MCCC 1A13808]RLP54382.1 MAG: hypothetical protein D6160_10100 [Ketobacter sp.]